MRFPAFIVSGAMVMAGCSFSRLYPDYQVAIDRAASLETREYSGVVGRSLEGAMWNWNRDPFYREIRESARRLSFTTKVHLEIGNQNKGSYEAVLIGQSREGPMALFRLGFRSKVESKRLSSSLLMGIYKNAIALSSQFDTCKSSLSLSDASAYFGMVEVEGESRKFAVYGLNFLPSINEEQRREALAMAPCKDFVSQVFEAIGKSPIPVIVGLESSDGAR